MYRPQKEKIAVMITGVAWGNLEQTIKEFKKLFL